MKNLAAVVATILFSSSFVCAQGHALNKTLTHDGVERDYILYVPSGYAAERATPLVLTFHSLNGNAGQMMVTTVMNEVAEQEGFLVAYPDSPGGWGANSNDNNIGFTDALVETIESDYTVDSSRIYANGLSDGGVMSYLLGVSRPTTFAAIASISGTRAGFDSSNLFPFFVDNIPDRPLPLLHMHGTDDVVIPYNGGVVQIPGVGDVPFPSTASVIADWATNNWCGELGSEVMLENVYSDDASTVSLFEYEDCGTYIGVSGEELTAEVLHYRVNDGGHAWPVLEAGREASIAALVEALGEDLVAAGGQVNSDLNASAVVWDFFQKHELAVNHKSFDCNGDKQTNGADLSCVKTVAERDILLGVLESLPGDLDGDGRVAFSDFLTLADNFGQDSAIYADGNIDLMNGIEFADFLILAENFGMQTSNSAAVPEPSGTLLAMFGMFGIIGFLRRR